MNRFAAKPFLFCSLLALATTASACGDNEHPEAPDAAEPVTPPDASAPDASAPDAARPVPTIVVSATTQTVNEGDAAGATLTIKLSDAPEQAVAVAIASSDEGAAVAAPASLSFDGEDYATEQTLTITAPQDPDDNNESVTLTLSAEGLASVTVTVTVIDDDALNILAAPTTLTVTEEGATASFDVRLTVQPDADVTVTIATSDAGAAVVDKTELTFTASNYDQPQTVTVTGVADADVADEAVTLTLSSDGLTDVTVNASVDDDDVQTIVVSTATLSVTEGDSTTFTVRLSNDPLGSVDVGLASNDVGAATVSPATLSFDSSNYDQPQTVTVAGVNDVDGNNEAVAITLSSVGLADATVDTTVLDDDSLNISASPTSVTVDEGGAVTFDVSLTVQPNADVIVNVASSDEGAATTSVTSLTFTQANYDQPQTVTVNGVDDADVANESVLVTLSSAGLTDVPVAVTVEDEDTQTILSSATSVSVTEGGDRTFTVRLSNDPLGSVGVTVDSSDTGAASVSPTLLTFDSSNYDQPQTVTVSGVEDADVVDESATVTLASAGLASVAVGVSVDDDDTQTIVRSPASLSLTEGGSNGTFTVRLSNDPLGSVSVSVTSSDTGAATASPASLTFDSSNYDQAQTVTVSPVSDADVADESVTVTLASAGLSNATVTVTVDDDDIQTLIVSTTTVAVNEGQNGTFTVRLSNDPLTPFTVNLASSDTGAVSVSPASLTFNSGNYDVAQTVTVTGVTDADQANESVTVTASGTGVTSATVTVTVTDNTPPYAPAMFVRFINPTRTNNALTYLGANRYRADLTLPMAVHLFKIADLSYTPATTFSVSATSIGQIQLNTETPLVSVPTPNNGNETLLSITQAGNYRFDFDATNPAAPRLTVTRLP